ncbi:MAG: hypothetical protein K0U41_01430 [Gammaproteobacteria bacterium]|nr:hypothetical protein [Gammaproteobacteria bacterium]
MKEINSEISDAKRNTDLFEALVSAGVKKPLAKKAAGHENNRSAEYYKLSFQMESALERLNNLESAFRKFQEEFTILKTQSNLYFKIAIFIITASAVVNFIASN